jgi:hypothetical protein
MQFAGQCLQALGIFQRLVRAIMHVLAVACVLNVLSSLWIFVTFKIWVAIVNGVVKPAFESSRLSVCRAQQEVSSPPLADNGAVGMKDSIPTPIIKIDNQHDPFATVVTIEYGDRLGELLDTVTSPFGVCLLIFQTLL